MIYKSYVYVCSYLVLEEMFRFKHPFTCIVAGPTQSGKTRFVFNILRNANLLITPAPTRIIWCHGEEQDMHKDLPSSVTLSEGFEGLDDIDPSERNLIIVDDLMNEASKNDRIGELFTKGSHHRNLSIILIVQNMFFQSKMMRTVSLNSHYMVLFKNPRDAGQIRSLASQLFPGKSGYLVDAYKQATAKPHGYLLLDLTQSTSEKFRVLSHILPEEEGYYYLPK